MRIAALAFGVVAGLIASLILALGGLDISATAQFASERQMQISRFGLFIIANLGVFGAGLVLASPLGGAVLFSVGALAWVLAALFLHHSTDLVLILPPALLLIAGGLSLISFLRRDRPIEVPPLRFGRRAARQGPGDYEQVPQIRVGAGFFGEGGTAQPLRNAADPNLGSMDERDAPQQDWEPGRRRAVPPRQRQVFRQPDMDEPEERGFSRVARGISSVLSFGLYAAVAGAVILVAWNLRPTGEHPAAAKLEPAATTAATPAPVKPAAPAAQPSAPAPALVQPSAPAPVQTQATAPAQPARTPPTGIVVATPTITPAPTKGQQTVAQPQPDQTALQPPGTQAASASDAQPDSSDQSSVASDTTQSPDAGTVMPYPMPPQIAAEQGGAPSKAARTTPATPLNSTGL